MKPTALFLWLTLFGGESTTEPSALAVERPSVHVSSAWVGVWVAAPPRAAGPAPRREAGAAPQGEPVVAQFTPVAGREELSIQLRFGEGPAATTETWVGRYEGNRLRLNRASVGEGRLTPTTDGKLAGRLTRNKVSGDLELSRVADEARARPAPLR